MGIAVLLLTFVCASLAVVTVSEIPPPAVTLAAGSIAAGCAAVLALLKQVGQSAPPEPPATPSTRLGLRQRPADPEPPGV